MALVKISAELIWLNTGWEEKVAVRAANREARAVAVAEAEVVAVAVVVNTGAWEEQAGVEMGA